ncbi:thioesterase family protein [Williamsia sp. CHRR-6]|nr:thioesterase family protein [Williamsia sp. CHRR-6]
MVLHREHPVSPERTSPEVAVAYTATVDPVFTIGPKVHGGALQTICGHAAVRAFGDSIGDPAARAEAAELLPVVVSTEYLGAPDPAEVTVLARVGKRGRRVSQVDVEVRQGDRTMVRSAVTLARPDRGEVHHRRPGAVADMAPTPPADAVSVREGPTASLFNLAGVLDVHYDASTVAFLDGSRGEPTTRFWTRPIGAEPDEWFAMIAADLSVPVVMNLQLYGWAPTLQMTTYLRRVPAPGWLRVQATTTEVGQGLFDEDHCILDSTGAVVAQSRQLAMIPTAV